MTAIKPAIYESLTTRQRIMAAIEAKARDDAGELVRLVETCPKKNYEMPDFAYQGMIHALERLGLAVSCDVYRLGGAFLAVHFSEKDEFVKEHHTLFCIQTIKETLTAWNELLEARGLDPEITSRAFLVVYTHPLLTAALEWEDGPQPDRESVKHIRSMLERAVDLREYGLPVVRNPE